MIMTERDTYFKILERLKITLNVFDTNKMEKKVQNLVKQNKSLIKFCYKLKDLANNYSMFTCSG